MNEYDVMYNVKMSFVHYIKEIFLKKIKYVTTKNKSILTVTGGKKYDLDSDIIRTDEYGNSSNQIKVTTDGEELSDSEFDFDYISNKIYFVRSHKNIKITYKQYSIEVIDAYPGSEITNFTNPIISVEVEDFETSPFEIGSRRKYWNGNVFIDCFCTNNAMRERLRGALTFELANQNIPVCDFTSQNVLNNDGTLNKNFVFYPSETEIYDIKRITAENYDLTSLDKRKEYVFSVSANFNLIF